MAKPKSRRQVNRVRGVVRNLDVWKARRLHGAGPHTRPEPVDKTPCYVCGAEWAEACDPEEHEHYWDQQEGR